MSEIDNITHALCMVQKKLQVPKNRVNSFAKYKYRNCEDILEAVKEVLHPNSAVTITDDIKLIGDRYYVEAIATFWFGDKFVSVKAFAREPLEKKGSDASQITGATSSYARKYALNGLFAIDDSDDSDSDDNSYHQKKTVREIVRNESPPDLLKGAVQVITTDQLIELTDMAKNIGTEATKVLDHYKIFKLQDCPFDLYEKVKASFVKRINEKSALSGKAQYLRA